MTETNVNLRAPEKMDYASPIQFRFKCTKLPEVEFFCQTANVPGISLGDATFATPLKDISIPGDTVVYSSLDMTFLVDENLNNYKEIHDWIIGLGFPQSHDQFKIYKQQVKIGFQDQQQALLYQVLLHQNLLMKEAYIQTPH